LNFSFA
jgi:hypothetical protein